MAPNSRSSACVAVCRVTVPLTVTGSAVCADAVAATVRISAAVRIARMGMSPVLLRRDPPRPVSRLRALERQGLEFGRRKAHACDSAHDGSVAGERGACVDGQ